MKLQFIGTGAADWLIKDKVDGEFFRYFSSTLLDDHVLIDLGTGVPLDKIPEIHEIYYTHSHDDHFCYESVLKLAEKHPITIYAEKTFAQTIKETDRISVVPLDPFVPVTTKLGYRLNPLRANHQTGLKGEITLCYVITKDDKRIFLGGDGAWFPCDTYNHMKALRPYDIMVVDGTLGEAHGDYRIFQHNSLPMVKLMYENFENMKFFSEHSKFFISHFSKLDQYSPKELDEAVKPYPIRYTLDGLEVNF